MKQNYDGWAIINKQGNFLNGSLYYHRSSVIDWWNETRQFMKWKQARKFFNYKIVKVKLVEVSDERQLTE